MAKTMEILRGGVLVLTLVLVPLIGATRLEELERKNEKLELKNEKLEAELVELKKIVSALQTQMEVNTAQMKKKVDVDDFATHFSLLEERLDVVESGVKLNDTEELEARVTVLEESVSDLEAYVVALEDDMEDVESANLLQDQRLNTMEAEIFDNENDIEELVDITTGLTTQISSLEEDLMSLDQTVEDLESGAGGGNVTDLEVRVETLEEVTSQLTDDVSSLEVNDVIQDERISSSEEDVTSLDQRVEDLESEGDYGDTVFLAALSSDDPSSADPVLYDREVINHGGHYNSSTGQYTVPYDGIYQFSVHLTAYNSSSSIYFIILVNVSPDGSHMDTYDVQQYYRSTTVLLELQAGERVSVYRRGGANGCPSCLSTYFCGHMISTN